MGALVIQESKCQENKHDDTPSSRFHRPPPDWNTQSRMDLLVPRDSNQLGNSFIIFCTTIANLITKWICANDLEDEQFHLTDQELDMVEGMVRGYNQQHSCSFLSPIDVQWAMDSEIMTSDQGEEMVVELYSIRLWVPMVRGTPCTKVLFRVETHGQRDARFYYDG